MALATSVEGDSEADALHVNHSWGIYETWCYLAVLQVVGSLLGLCAEEIRPSAVAAQLAHRLTLSDGVAIETYFHAVFPSEEPSSGRVGWSISRERRPDILLVLRQADDPRAMVLDAKWRSGRSNVLEAMESAHIYHDALRLHIAPPTPCVLLLPGPPAVASIGSPSYIKTHSVGALSSVTVDEPGLLRVRQLIADWAGLVAA